MTRGICSDPIKEAERVRKQKEGAQRRSQDPEWKRKNKEATQRTAQLRAQDPEWRKQNLEMCEKRSLDPEWRRKRKEAAQKLAKDPTYIKKLSDAAIKREKDPEMYRRRSQNPEWIKNHDETSRKLAQDPEWKRSHKEAMKKLGKDQERRRKLIEFAIGGFWYGNVRYYEGQMYCEKFNEDLKERVRAYFNHTCPDCGTPQNGIKLAVHHVNYNKQSCCDPDAQRLFVPLCVEGGCHQRTNRNRKEWEEYFAKMLMGYYQGKCYFTPEEMEAYSG